MKETGRKTSRQVFFEVDLDWLADTRGRLRSTHTEGTIAVATPPEFGGSGRPWTPEHLFLGALSSCFMTTFLAFANKYQFTIAGLTCHAIGQIEIVGGAYKFTTINIYPTITLASGDLKEKAGKALEKTHKYCIVTNSVNATVYYHPEIVTVSEEVSLRPTTGDEL